MKCDNCGKPDNITIQGIGTFDQPMFFCDGKCSKEFYDTFDQPPTQATKPHKGD